ncbi:TonB-dependent receptor [bacterium]|nr:TonB-dependent receptor [bacterium]
MKPYVLLAAFIALGVVLGYTFMAVPNVELVTATVFLCGYVMGIRFGILGGLATETIYGILNPQGIAPPPLLIAMILSMTITGAAGGISKHLIIKKGVPLVIVSGLAGFLCTLLFAALTTLGYLVSSSVPYDQLCVSMLAGAPLYLTHLIVNTIIFITVVPLLVQWIQKHRALFVMAGVLLITFRPPEVTAQIYVHQIQIDQTPEINYRHLGDLVQYLPGIRYRNLGYGGNWAGLRIWGSPLYQSQINLNGFALKDPVTGMADLRLIPVEMVKSIGLHPLSACPGQNAMGGPLFIQSKSINMPQPYTKAVYRTGPNKWSDLDMTFGQKFTDNFSLLSGMLLHNEGEGTSYTHHSQQIRSDIQWQPFPAIGIGYTILHNVFKSDLQYPVTAPLDTVFMSDPNLKRDQADHMLRSTFYHGNWPVQLSWHHTNTKYRLRDHYSSQKDTLQGHRNQWTVEQQIPFRNNFGALQIQVEEQSLSADTIDARRVDWEALLQMRQTLLTDGVIDLQMGCHRRGNESLIFGKGLFIFNRDTSLTTWLGLGRNFREPTLAEETGLHFLPTAPAYGDHWTLLHFSNRMASNGSLHPEYAWSWDTGIRIQRPAFNTSICGYYRTSDQLLKLDEEDGRILYRNKGQQTYYGCETQTSLTLGSHFQASLVCNLSRATEQRTSMLERPDIWGVTTISSRHIFFDNDLDCRIVIQAHFWSEFYSLYGYELENLLTIYHQPDWLVNGKCIFRIMQNGIISFSLDNILDTSAAFTDGFGVPGRSFRIGYVWELYN